MANILTQWVADNTSAGSAVTPSQSKPISTYINNIKTILQDKRDIYVKVIDASNTMNALHDLQDIPKDKPYIIITYIIIMDKYDLSSSILNRELDKMKAIAISKRKNALGHNYGVCQFMIAVPKDKVYMGWKS